MFSVTEAAIMRCSLMKAWKFTPSANNRPVNLVIFCAVRNGVLFLAPC